jgi:hypothetical protein
METKISLNANFQQLFKFLFFIFLRCLESTNLKKNFNQLQDTYNLSKLSRT